MLPSSLVALLLRVMPLVSFFDSGGLAMRPKLKVLTLILGFSVFSYAAPKELVGKRSDRSGMAASAGSAVLWKDPSDIASRDLFYGPGGKTHQPSGAFTFVKEDLEASSPKFVVRDADGVEWKVKLGGEARSETAATRIVWAVGYFTDEDYLLRTLRVANMPLRLHRGQSLVAADGSMTNARLERHRKGIDKAGIWKWRSDSVWGTRELDGLRVMMALINNWDLKDVNNAVYSIGSGEKTKQVYVVSDLGASFGSPGFSWPMRKSRGNLESYSRSTFISKVTPEHVDFSAPGRPALIRAVAASDFVRRLRMRSIGKRISREHAKWIGEILGRLSQDQIRSAFRGAGYSPLEVEGFAKVVETRIAQLNEL